MIKTLRNKNFLIIITGKLISLMGNAIFEIALIWYVLSRYEKTSGTILALIMLMAVLPTVILGSLAGSMVDRYNKKYIMIFSDLIGGGAVFVVYVLMGLGKLNILEILIATGVLSVTSSTVRIVVSSIIPDLFKDKELYDANGTNQFIERGTSLLGYALGGGLIAILGVKNAILLDGVSFMVCAFLEMFLLLPKRPTERIKEGKNNIIKDLWEVKLFLVENKTLLRVVLVFTGINFLLDPLLNIAMPYVLKNIYNVSSTNFGLIIASLPLGFCIGALYFSKRPKFLLNKYVLFNSILGINILITFLAIPIALSLHFVNKNLIVYYFMLCLSLSGIFSAAINISASVVMQREVPDDIRGKFMGITSSLSAGLMPLGCLIVGALVGVVNTSLIYGFSIVAIFIIIIVVPKNSYSYES